MLYFRVRSGNHQLLQSWPSFSASLAENEGAEQFLREFGRPWQLTVASRSLTFVVASNTEYKLWVLCQQSIRISRSTLVGKSQVNEAPKCRVKSAEGTRFQGFRHAASLQLIPRIKRSSTSICSIHQEYEYSLACYLTALSSLLFDPVSY